MKCLLGVVLAGSQKDYCVPKFLEQCEKVFSGVDVLFVTDLRNYDVLVDHGVAKSLPGVAVLYNPDLDVHNQWATEIVHHGKELLRSYLLSQDYDGYDALIWQGVDCFYDRKADFDKLLTTGEKNNAQIIGALVAGRNRPDYPVCRAFRSANGVVTKDQIELNPEVLSGNSPTPIAGYIGSDATLLKRWILTHYSMEGYEPWHTRPDKDTPLAELGPEEWIMWDAIANRHSIPVCHTGIRPWHVHETGRAVRYPNQECDLGEITWGISQVIV